MSRHMQLENSKQGIRCIFQQQGVPFIFVIEVGPIL